MFSQDDDEDDKSRSGSGSGSESDSRASAGRKKKKKKRRRSRSPRSDEEIDEEDMELLEENLGIQIKKQRKRIKMDSGSDDDDDDDAGRRREAERRDRMEDDDLPDLDAAPSAGGAGGDEADEAGYDSGDVNDFIVDEEGQPIQREKRKKKTHIFGDAARQQAEDIFGVAFDYDEFDQYGDEEYDSEDEDDEDRDDRDDDDVDGGGKAAGKKKRRKKKAKSIFEIFEPSELEHRHFTDLDNEIRNTDVPERMQLRTVPVTAVPEGSDELEKEADWIYRHAFVKPTVSKQPQFGSDDIRSWERKDNLPEQIKLTLDFIRQQFHEVPSIAFYRREYAPDLKINELWRVYKWDELWCKLQTRKANLRKLAERMQAYQSDTIMADPDAPLPEGTRIISNEDLDKIDQVETFEELKDRDQHFKLYYGRDLEPMQEALRKKRREEREAKRMRKSQKKAKRKKTKTIVNEEGEEVEVTDNEAPVSEDEDEEDDEEEEDDDLDLEEETLKMAKRNDPFTICKRYGMVGMVGRFGLTAEQFGENLHDGYSKVDVEQDPAEPLEAAAEYTSERFKTPQEVLDAAKYVLAMQIARDPLVRKVVRETFYERATISVRPTKKGMKEIDESHEIFVVGDFHIRNKDAAKVICHAGHAEIIHVRLHNRVG